MKRKTCLQFKSAFDDDTGLRIGEMKSFNSSEISILAEIVRGTHIV